MKILLGLIFVIFTLQAKDYKFSNNWFHEEIKKDWLQRFAQLKGKEVNYLEVGVWEGHSFFWMLENIATATNSKLVAVDIFTDKKATNNFYKNLDVSQAKNKIEVIKGFSQIELKKLRENSFDIIYIDGSHRGMDVLTDGVLAWRLLKNGGVLIFDDYDMEFDGVYPRMLETWPAIDAFIQSFDGEIVNVEKKNEQVFITKEDICYLCVHFCAGVYDFEAKTFARAGKKVSLSKAENAILTHFLDNKPYAMPTYQFVQNLNQPDYRKFLTNDAKKILNKMCPAKL